MAAETILIPIAKQILGKAADLALEQLGLLWNFRRELRKLKDTVSRIQAVLRDAEEKQFRNHQVKDWLEKLSDVMYDADDVLDDLATEARRKAVLASVDDVDYVGRTTTTTSCWSLVCFLFSSLPKQLLYDLKMAHAIKAITEKLDDISKDKEILHLEVHPIEEDEALPYRETDSFPPTIVVGREDDKNNIIHLLLNSNQEASISVVSIVGMGGLGKTTLAQLVFDDDQVKAHFDIKAWVYVSQSFDVKVILEKMLRSIDRQSQASPELDDLQVQLRGKIEGKRFLFVLDDIWEETNRSWEALGKYLRVGAAGSKVLLTTRSTKVAEVGDEALKSETSTSIVKLYHLKGLSQEECWNLLMKKALPRKIPRDTEVQKIGKQILSKCCGVPLSVSTIVGVLVDSIDPMTEWPSFLQKGLSSITKGEEDPTMSTLQISFNHLPSRMKHCFTYCKLFPKGYEFNIKMLVQFWVAQGYIESEDEGFDCFKTLWWRSFFQEVELDELGKMSTCRMHDLMHDLSDIIAGEKIIRRSSSTVLKTIPSKTRHLFITGDSDDDPREDYDRSELRNASKVRTLICAKSLSNEELDHVFSNFLHLRVLMILEKNNSVLDASTSLNFVDKLKHLRYLGLGCRRWEKFPNSVTNLVNLQVLNFIGGHSLKELPRDIKKLVNLKHLDLCSTCPDYLTHIPKGIGELKFLQTLPIFVVGKRSGGSSNNDKMVGAELDELKGLNALSGRLTIKGLANVNSPKKDVYVLKEKLHLQLLFLDWCRDDDHEDNDVGYITPFSTYDEGTLEMLQPHTNLKVLIIYQGYEGVKFSNWLSGLTNLVEFLLDDCKRCEYLPQLHQLSSLKKLTIYNCPLLKGINNDGDHCDSSLDNSATRLTVKEDDDAQWPQFRCLADLRIRNCPRLARLPTFPTVEGELVLEKVSLVPFARTMKMKMRGGVDCLDDANIRPPSSALVHPLSKLIKLTLSDTDDNLESLAHQDLSSCLISLQKFTILSCSRGVKLPGSLCSSTYLTEIYIRDYRTVEYLPPLHELPSLKSLIIWNCPRLKGCWWKKKKGNNNNNNGDDDCYYNFDPSMEREGKEKEDEETEEWPHFPCLSRLRISFCPKLTRMPLFPTIEGELKLNETSIEALVRTMKMKPVAAQQPSTTATTSATSSSSASLSKLNHLFLVDVADLESLPEEGLLNLTSLRRLTIEKCPRVASLPPAMRRLTSLQSLYIGQCAQLKERCRKGEGEDWPNISHIPYIELDEKPLQNTAQGKR